MLKSMLRAVSHVCAIAGVGGISQSVAGHVVAKCADPNLTEEQFRQLIEEVSKEGYELKYV